MRTRFPRNVSATQAWSSVPKPSIFFFFDLIVAASEPFIPVPF
jgi:hypothetical protein